MLINFLIGQMLSKINKNRDVNNCHFYTANEVDDEYEKIRSYLE